MDREVLGQWKTSDKRTLWQPWPSSFNPARSRVSSGKESCTRGTSCGAFNGSIPFSPSGCARQGNCVSDSDSLSVCLLLIKQGSCKLYLSAWAFKFMVVLSAFVAPCNPVARMLKLSLNYCQYVSFPVCLSTFLTFSYSLRGAFYEPFAFFISDWDYRVSCHFSLYDFSHALPIIGINSSFMATPASRW